MEVFSAAIASLVSIVIAIIFVILVLHVLKKKDLSEKKFYKIKMRLLYVSVIILLLILIKIWVGGISHLLTMLSLVAAGLVIVNKENVMNFTGWIIINWRSLFSEGDYIHILNYNGVVAEIKLFYFRIYETIEHGDKRTTGKLIKIPNATIITNAVSTFTSDENIVLYKSSFLVDLNKNTLNSTDTAKTIINRIIAKKYKFNNDFSESSLITKAKLKQCGIYNFKPIVELKPVIDRENVINIQTSFYCFMDDKKELEQEYLTKLITETANDLETNKTKE
ncbi:mechanosensitive ion channel [Francisellaceae bacterium CB299]|jgi:small-conductance mechanosensitive channel